MLKRRSASLLIGLLFFLLGARSAWADGIIIPIPRPPYPVPPLRSLAIKYHRVTVTIDGQIARTHVDQVFLNESGYEMEGQYVFPLPEGASISQFAMWVDGQRLEAELLDRDQARQIYEDIVRQQRDPALLEYVGQNAFRARVYPIPARGEKRIEIEYTEILPKDHDLVKYVYPLNTEKFSTRPLQDVSVIIKLRSAEPLKAIYSPSHEIQVTKGGANQAEISYRERDVLPSKDFVLYYSANDADLGLSLMTYKETGDQGFFLLLLSPKAEVQQKEIIAKDVFFVLDVSGSMRGNKLTQAKAAARYVLDNLNPDDRFNIVAFGSSTSAFASSLRPLSEAAQARRFIDGLAASGGTNISRALEETLAQTSRQRPQVIIFLTDGLATEGERNSDKIIQRVREQASDNVRIFTFGVGYDVNTTLLDTIAQAHHGVSAYVRPEEDLEQAISSFFEKISQPMITGVSLDWGGIQVEDVYPYPLPDLFAGTQMVVVGRYRQAGSATLTLRGRAGEEQITMRFPNLSFRDGGGSDFIPRLWATRKIGYLLTQIRLYGTERELVEAVVELSIRYGIITPYTSFLVNETEDALTADGKQALVGREMNVAPSAAPRAGEAPKLAATAPASGVAAVERSIAQEALRQADVAAQPESYQVRQVGNKTFVLRNEAWVDTLYDPSRIQAEPISFGSERYFALLRAHPQWTPFLALGQRVTLVWEGQAYAIAPGQVEQPANPANAPTISPTPGSTGRQGDRIYNDCYRLRSIG